MSQYLLNICLINVKHIVSLAYGWTYLMVDIFNIKQIDFPELTLTMASASNEPGKEDWTNMNKKV